MPKFTIKVTKDVHEMYELEIEAKDYKTAMETHVNRIHLAQHTPYYMIDTIKVIGANPVP